MPSDHNLQSGACAISQKEHFHSHQCFTGSDSYAVSLSVPPSFLCASCFSYSSPSPCSVCQLVRHRQLGKWPLGRLATLQQPTSLACTRYSTGYTHSASGCHAARITRQVMQAECFIKEHLELACALAFKHSSSTLKMLCAQQSMTLLLNAVSASATFPPPSPCMCLSGCSASWHTHWQNFPMNGRW